MDEKKGQKKIRTPWLLGTFVLFLLTILVLLQSSNLWKYLAIETASDTLILYALSSLNFVAFVIFGFILIRNLLKLQRERRASLLGSRIKSRLLFYFIVLSLLPIIAMAVFSYLFLNRAIERWFAQFPENTIREAQKIYDESIYERKRRVEESTRMLVVALEDQKIDETLLASLLGQGDLNYLGLFSKNRQRIIEKRATDFEEKTDEQGAISNLTDEIVNGQAAPTNLIFALTEFRDGRILLAIPKDATNQTANAAASNSLREFDRLKNDQLTVRRIGLSTIALLTLLLIFASSWAAFYLARGFTVPIKALAEGANEIAHGNLSYRVNAFAEDELALLVSAFNEMSSRLEANSVELRERRKYIETILQSLSAGVISFDANNRVTTINRAAIRMLKLENANFENFSLIQLLRQENFATVEKLIGRAKRIGHATEQTTLFLENSESDSSAGASIPVALGATALPDDAKGNAGGVAIVIEDLSELIRAQRAAAWQEVARRMAHEFKNPLTPIQLSAERIAKRFDDLERTNGKDEGEFVLKDDRRSDGRSAEVIRDGTETILREVSSLKSMVDEFSRFARLPEIKLEPGNLNEVVNQALALYEDRHQNIEIEASLARDLPKALLDAEQIKRVFVNLIDNSLEAFSSTQDEKRIRVSTVFDRSRDVLIAEVSDNGNGISEGDLSKLFHPYFSTKGRGTGLGLAIVERIVREHQGRVSAIRNEPRGARFVVEIPAAA